MLCSTNIYISLFNQNILRTCMILFVQILLNGSQKYRHTLQTLTLANNVIHTYNTCNTYTIILYTWDIYIYLYNFLMPNSVIKLDQRSFFSHTSQISFSKSYPLEVLCNISQETKQINYSGVVWPFEVLLNPWILRLTTGYGLHIAKREKKNPQKLLCYS